MATTVKGEAEITCVVAAHSHAFAARVAQLLAENGFVVVATVTDGEAALAAIETFRPRVVLLDLPQQLSGVDVAERAHVEHPETAAIFCSEPDDREHLAEGLRVGVRGFVRKDVSADALFDAVRVAATGGTYLDPELTPALIRSAVQAPIVPLSEREAAVLHLLADGKTNAEIGAALFVSPDTVRTYVRRAMKKLEADNRTHAVAIALRESLIT